MAKSPLLVTRYWSRRKNSSFSKMKLICEHSCTMDRFNLPEMWAKRKAERKLCLVKFLGQRNFAIQTFCYTNWITFPVNSDGPPVGSVAWTLPFPFRERASRGSIRYITDWTATLWNSYSLWLVKGCTAPVHKLAVRPTMWQTLYWWIFEMLDFLKCIPNPEGLIRKGFMTRHVIIRNIQKFQQTIWRGYLEVETFKNILKQFYDKFHTSRGVHWLDCTFDIDARNGYRDSRNVIEKLFQNLTSMPLRILRFLREHH